MRETQPDACYAETRVFDPAAPQARADMRRAIGNPLYLFELRRDFLVRKPGHINASP
jgi:hypothetical protein